MFLLEGICLSRILGTNLCCLRGLMGANVQLVWGTMCDSKDPLKYVKRMEF